MGGMESGAWKKATRCSGYYGVRCGASSQCALLKPCERTRKGQGKGSCKKRGNNTVWRKQRCRIRRRTRFARRLGRPYVITKSAHSNPHPRRHWTGTCEATSTHLDSKIAPKRHAPPSRTALLTAHTTLPPCSRSSSILTARPEAVQPCCIAASLHPWPCCPVAVGLNGTATQLSGMQPSYSHAGDPGSGPGLSSALPS